MELDEYKRQTYQRTTFGFRERSTSELAAIMHHKVDSVVEKMKRSISLEVIAALISVLFTAYVLVYYPNYIMLLASGTLFFCAFFLVYFLSLYRKIDGYYSRMSSVRETVEQLIKIIENFIRLYFRVTMVFIPVIFMLVFFSIAANQQNFPFTITSNRVAVFALAAVVWSIVMYYFTRWYVHMLYGKHLQTLKTHLDELKNVQQEETLTSD